MRSYREPRSYFASHREELQNADPTRMYDTHTAELKKRERSGVQRREPGTQQQQKSLFRARQFAVRKGRLHAVQQPYRMAQPCVG